MDFETLLKLFKINIGVSHNKRDEFYTSYIQSSYKELDQKGVKLNLQILEDQMLLTDYTTWSYLNRKNDVDLSRNLQLRIRNRIVKERAADKNG